jgi:glucosamine-6-phosphate deaminase
VITQGLATIGEARHLILIASGPHKAQAVAAAVEGPVTARCPASILQLHPHVTVVLDELAASQLRDQHYYRYVARHKPASQGY